MPKMCPRLVPISIGIIWIDLDEYYQIDNGLNSIEGIPEELETKNGLMIVNWSGRHRTTI
jgi:hypothetical protein